MPFLLTLSIHIVQYYLIDTPLPFLVLRSLSVLLSSIILKTLSELSYLLKIDLLMINNWWQFLAVLWSFILLQISCWFVWIGGRYSSCTGLLFMKLGGLSLFNALLTVGRRGHGNSFIELELTITSLCFDTILGSRLELLLRVAQWLSLTKSIMSRFSVRSTALLWGSQGGETCHQWVSVDRLSHL